MLQIAKRQSEAQDYHDILKLQGSCDEYDFNPREWLRDLPPSPTNDLALHLSSRVNMAKLISHSAYGPSLGPYILARPWLSRWMVPISEWYSNAAGYRRLGTTS